MRCASGFSMLPSLTPSQQCNARFGESIDHTEPRHSCSNRHEPGRLQLNESPGPVLSAFLSTGQIMTLESKPMRTYILVVNPKESLCSSIPAASFG